MENVHLNPIVNATRFQILLEKVMSINMPSMAVINGHAYAGGFLFALAHDFRIMKSTRARVCISEINLGFGLGTIGLLDVCKSTLTKKSFRELILGIAWEGPRALEGKVVDNLYNS